MEFVKKNIKWIGLGGNALAILGLFLPFATMKVTIFGTSLSESVTYIEGDGKIVLITIVIAAILTLMNKDKIKLLSLASLGIGAIISIYAAINTGKVFNDTGSQYSSLIDTYFGIGFYLLFIGLIISIISVIYDNFILDNNKIVSSNLNMDLTSLESTIENKPDFLEPTQPLIRQPQPNPMASVSNVQPTNSLWNDDTKI